MMQNNTPTSLEIQIAMGMWWSNVRCIARWSTSRASLETTGCRNWASAWDVSPGGRHGQRFLMKHKNTNKTQILASDYHTFFSCNRVTFGTQHRLSIQLIDATSW